MASKKKEWPYPFCTDEGLARMSSRMKSYLPRILEGIAEHGNPTRVCREFKVNRRTVYEWRHNDPLFCQRWEEAIELSADVLEAEAQRRAVEGYERPIYQRGELIGHETMYSDRLLEFLLKGAIPSKYRDRIQHSTDPDAPLIPGDEANKTDVANRIAFLLDQGLKRQEEKGNDEEQGNDEE